MPKDAVDVNNLTNAELVALAAEFGITAEAIAGHRKLYGGYSGTNYRLDLNEGGATRSVVVKVFNGYDLAFVQRLCDVLLHVQVSE